MGKFSSVALEPLRAVLLAGTDLEATTRPLSRHERAVEQFTLVPSARRPRLALPEGNGPAARAALQQYTHGAGRAARLVARSAGLVLGARGRLPGLCRFSVLDPLPDAPVEQLPFLRHLRELGGWPNSVVAVRLGPPRPNRKPVFQVLTPDGDVLAYAKVGWEPLSRRLVRREAAVLQRLHAARDWTHPAFELPRVIHFGTWESLEILVMEAIAADRRPWLGHKLGLPVEATRQVAAQTVGDRAPLAGSAYWSGINQRVTDTGSERLAQLTGRVEERFGEVETQFASWHGDWLPSNLLTGQGRLHVLDWERSGDLVPLGLDAVHFLSHVVARRGRKLRDAVPQVERAAADGLALVGGRSSDAPMLVGLNLLEMALRFEEAHAASLPVSESHHAKTLELLLAD